MPLFALHLYSPASALLTLFIHRVFSSVEIVPLSIGDPFLVHENLGFGFPMAWQEKEIYCPVTFVVSLRRIVICGSSIYKENFFF